MPCTWWVNIQAENFTSLPSLCKDHLLQRPTRSADHMFPWEFCNLFCNAKCVLESMFQDICLQADRYNLKALLDICFLLRLEQTKMCKLAGNIRWPHGLIKKPIQLFWKNASHVVYSCERPNLHQVLASPVSSQACQELATNYGSGTCTMLEVPSLDRTFTLIECQKVGATLTDWMRNALSRRCETVGPQQFVQLRLALVNI